MHETPDRSRAVFSPHCKPHMGELLPVLSLHLPRIHTNVLNDVGAAWRLGMFFSDTALYVLKRDGLKVN